MTHAELAIIADKLATHWIPISEEPPEDSDFNYQLSCGKKDSGYPGYAIGHRAGGRWWCSFTGKEITAEINAYMPLPKGY